MTFSGGVSFKTVWNNCLINNRISGLRREVKKICISAIFGLPKLYLVIVLDISLNRLPNNNLISAIFSLQNGWILIKLYFCFKKDIILVTSSPVLNSPRSDSVKLLTLKRSRILPKELAFSFSKKLLMISGNSSVLTE